MTAANSAQHWDSRYAGSDRVWSAEPNAWVAATIGAWNKVPIPLGLREARVKDQP